MFETIVPRINRLRFNAARDAGRFVEAWVLLTFVFVRSGEERDIRILPNHLHNVDELGIDYVAPQRVLGDPSFSEPCSDIKSVLVAAEIGEDGRPSDVTIVDSLDEGIEDCLEAFVELMTNSRYIPARRDGVPVRAKYLEIFFSISAHVGRP